MLKQLYRLAVIRLARPYVRRELPGWGVIYRWLVGSHRRDWLWEGERERWTRGKLHGHEMSLRIAGWSNRATFFLERFYDLPTQLLLQRELHEGDTFLDVGANEGMMTLVASQVVGRTGKVIACEPNPIPRGILDRNLQRNRISNVELHGVGLGDKAGELQLFVPRVNTGEGSFTAPRNAKAGEYWLCAVRTGDDLVADRRPRLIKIDVEGFEAHVLRGLRNTLKRDRPIIVMEMIAQHLARDGQDPRDLCQWLSIHGYEGRRLALKGRREFRTEPIGVTWQDGDYVFRHRQEQSG